MAHIWRIMVKEILQAHLEPALPCYVPKLTVSELSPISMFTVSLILCINHTYQLRSWWSVTCSYACDRITPMTPPTWCGIRPVPNRNLKYWYSSSTSTVDNFQECPSLVSRSLFPVWMYLASFQPPSRRPNIFNLYNSTMPLPLHIQSCGNSLENRLSSPTTIIVRRAQ